MVVKIASRSIPDRISHYTTLDGFCGIISSGQIWASSVSFLNDRRELQHGLEASLEAIELFTTAKIHKPWHDALKNCANELSKGAIPNTYAACFCQNSDLLSQWRGYGGAQQGISLTFDRKRLSTLMQPSGANLIRIIYGNISTTTKMTKELKKTIGKLSDAEEIIGLSDSSDRNTKAYQAICSLLPQFKHFGFHDEREVRYVVQTTETGDDVCFRVVGNVIVPFLKLLPEGAGTLPIVSVTVGPGRDQDLTKKSVRLYLDQRGYAGVKIKLSDVPFRS